MTLSDRSIIGTAKVNIEYITDNNMKLLIVLIASAQRGRRESPSQTCSLSFYSFLGYVKIPTQINSSCCKMLYH